MIELSGTYNLKGGVGRIKVIESHPHEKDLFMCELDMPSHALHGKQFMFHTDGRFEGSSAWPLPDAEAPVASSQKAGDLFEDE